jgi:replication initiation and membrane attachment protein DnaB
MTEYFPIIGAFAFAFYMLSLILTVWSIEKRVRLMIEQHWDLLDYTTSNGTTFKDIESFYEAKKNKKGGK